eukprot:s659_g37.t1
MICFLHDQDAHSASAGRRSAPMPVDNVIRELSSDSDNELDAAPKEPVRPAKRRRRQKSASVAKSREDKSSEKFLRSILGRECSCKKRDCLQQFIPEEDFQPLLEYRRRWCDLLKLDQDSYDSLRADVVSYLTRVYESIAESIPDIRDSAFDDLAPARRGSAETLDVYAIELKRQAEENTNMVAKPRKRRKSVELNMERTHGETAKEIKYLPPGFLKEYYVQYVSVSTLPQPASFPTFWRVTGPELFIDLISFRI